jgi:hypothetical protein
MAIGIGRMFDCLFGESQYEEDEDVLKIDQALDVLGISEEDLSKIMRYKADPLQFCLGYLNTTYAEYIKFQNWRSKTKTQKIEELVPNSNSFVQFSWLAFASLKVNKQSDENWRFEDWNVHLDKAKETINTFNKEDGYSLKKVFAIMRYLFFMVYIATYGKRATRVEQLENHERIVRQLEENDQLTLPTSIQSNVEIDE